ncbi:hypothetical protein [Hyalangium versicolor]|uniref:hypothetical protein n=1 Tax=Hyalangium versicolor TaxID=2861190 RepID=UPI001CCB5D18|nr:hypothetical protein [Hyalangium versicolor]
MDKPVSVEELLGKAQACDGQLVTVEGQFVAMFDGSVLCAPRSALEVTPDRPRITLECPELVDRCFQVLSPYVGGPWYYNDPAVVSGRFLAQPEPRLVELSAVVIRRPGTEHRIPL